MAGPVDFRGVGAEEPHGIDGSCARRQDRNRVEREPFNSASNFGHHTIVIVEGSGGDLERTATDVDRRKEDGGKHGRLVR